jgi:hypothetical protein
MRSDHSWNRPGRQYLNVYEHIRRGRRVASDRALLRQAA